MAQNASVVALTGRVLVINAAGTPRLLAVGEALQAGDTIRPAPGASVELALDDGQKLTLGGDQALLLGADVPVAADPAATAAIQTVIATLERGGDLSDLEATAAGLVAGGGGDGSSFVQLLRITEGVTPLEYQYGFNPQGIPPSVRGLATPDAGIAVSPPPGGGGGGGGGGGDDLPVADDDSSVASVSVAEFKGEITNYGNHEGGDSFRNGLVKAEDDDWLVSNESVLEGSLKDGFTLTDKGGGNGSKDGEVGSAYVVTPTFQVEGEGSFQFKVTTALKSGDTFSAKVYQNEDGTWALVQPLTFTVATSGNHEHTFNLDEGEYRISFNVDDGTSGGGSAGKASATIDVNSDLYFYNDVSYQPATGDILVNDTLGDGNWSDHDWAFAGGVEDSDGWVTVDGQYGTLVVKPDGDYTYTPDGSGGGTDTFTYTLTDADGDSDTASLSIQVDYTADGNSSSSAPMAMTMDAADDGSPEVLATGFSETDDDGEALADSVEDGAYALNSADMVVDLPDSEDFGEADAGNNTVRSFNLAPKGEGGDSLDLSDVVSGDDFSAEALDNYLSFGADDDGRAVVTIDPGGDINGDGIPDALQTITFDNVTFDELQAYGGDSDIDIIQKLLDNGNLSKDA